MVWDWRFSLFGDSEIEVVVVVRMRCWKDLVSDKASLLFVCVFCDEMD